MPSEISSCLVSACTHGAAQLALGDSKHFGYSFSLYRPCGSKHRVKTALDPPPLFSDTSGGRYPAIGADMDISVNHLFWDPMADMTIAYGT